MNCPYCNQEVREDVKFCSYCGQALNQEAVVPADSEPPKKSKKWMLPAAAVAVAALAGGAYFMMSQVDPKEAVIGAFKSITAEGQLSPTEEIFGLSAMSEKLSTGSRQVYMDLTLEESSDPTLNQMASGKLAISSYDDKENNRMAVDMVVGYGGMDLASVEFYRDETQIAAAIPELSEKLFVVNYTEDLEGQIKNSPFIGMLLEQNGTDLTGLNRYLEKSTEAALESEALYDLEALWNRYKEGSQAIEDLKAAMVVEKLDKNEFTMDVSAKNCKGYHVTITKDALLQFIKATKDFFLDDEILKSDMLSHLEMMLELQGTMVMMADPSMPSAAEMQEELWEEYEKQMDDVIKALEASMGDVTMNVYVRKGGQMAAFDYETPITVEEETGRLYGEVSFADGYSMLANVGAALHLEDPNGDTISFLLDKTGSYEAGKAYTAGLTGSMEIEGESYGFVYDSEYQAEDSSYALTLDLRANGESQAKLTASSYFDKLEKGESFALVIESLKLETLLLGDGNEYLELSGSYEVGPLTDEVEMPEGEGFDVLAGTEEAYDEILAEITGNLFGLMMKFY